MDNWDDLEIKPLNPDDWVTQLIDKNIEDHYRKIKSEQSETQPYMTRACVALGEYTIYEKMWIGVYCG